MTNRAETEMVERLVETIASGVANGLSTNAIARLCLAALRDPTPEMVDAAIAPYRHGNTDEFTAIMQATVTGYWQAMVDAALSPTKQEEEGR